MYTWHKLLSNLDEKCILWKYMSFSKFVNMLTGKVYFNRLDNFEDVFEGTFPRYNAEHRKEIYGCSVMSNEKFDAIAQMTRGLLYVLCFHKSEYETAFMWKQYADNDGVAIKTSSDRLKRAFDKTEKSIYIGDVKYIDYDKEFMPEGNAFYLALHKRKSFEPEREVRCIYMVDDLNETNSYGKLIEVDLAQLIEEIYVSPYAEPYIKENVELIVDKFNISANVIQSKLFTLN